MYFKMIANHPKYMSELGGDLSFTGCVAGGSGCVVGSDGAVRG